MADLQEHIQALRQQLDDSIKLHSCRQQQTVINRSSNGERSVEPVIPKNRRILHMLHQDETSACVQIKVNF
ncbi:unnamed protein product [Onchocerca flexuosa]|uniref:Uncharacterized protein n=1 Tax=Onchocerca flexuosa TaxID=387005 RepID=A0A183H899_9BILA|nr:unnamed protein product [Onchocerca flexuosa]